MDMDEGKEKTDAEEKIKEIKVNAEAAVTVSKDELEAYIKINPPENGGADLSFADLKILLVKNGIMFGIDNAALKNLADKPVYKTEVPIARGVSKEDGANAEIVYHVETEHQLKPKEREDGSVDFRDLGAVHEAKKGMLLCEKIPATSGIQGNTVKGRAIMPTPGKDKSMPAGKNTEVSQDGLKLLSMSDGHISIVGGKINILEIFVVPGNVSSHTGNINFTGSVVIKGDVTQGFFVHATGDVTIHGFVESANIAAGGALIIKSGFRGGETGELTVGGNAACAFIEGGQISVKGNLETAYIIGATVKCGGSINLNGRGLIRGGHLTARESVSANYIGSSVYSVTTIIEVGSDPEVIARFKEISQNIEAYEKNIKDVESVISALTKLKEVNRLTPDKAAQLEKAQEYKNNLNGTFLEQREEHEKLKAQMAEIGYGRVNVKNTAYHGTKIIIGSDILTLQSDHSFATFSRGKDGITFVPYR